MCLLGKYIIKGEEDNSECQEIADSGMQIGNPHSEQIQLCCINLPKFPI
jgi:hypothetical protein